MVDGDRGVRSVARRVRYVSWDDSSDCDGGIVGVVGDCGGGNGEGGGGDVDRGGGDVDSVEISIDRIDQPPTNPIHVPTFTMRTYSTP